MPKIAVLGFWTHHWQAIWNMSFRGTLGLFRAFSMIVGRIAPLAQTNLKRLLAYSSVGHIGLILIPLCGANLSLNGITEASAITAIPGDSIGVLWAYMLIYAIINVGVWSMLLWPMYRP
jgi:NADH:ubiquinone oxidoreductase subunit 2 (subunit N)